MTNQANDMTADKATIRSRLLAVRRECAPDVRSDWSAAACALLLDASFGARTVAAYASFGTEPDTASLLAGLAARDVRVLLPILENDGDLAWGWYSGPDSLVRATGPILQPSASLGVHAVLDADIVVLPGLAVDSRGMRLGRGGGSYDRVMARIAKADRAVRPWTVALLYPAEVGVAVPAEPHDCPVDAAVTADGMTRFR